VWPLGPDYFDLVFEAPVDFMGSQSEDPFVVAAGDTSVSGASTNLKWIGWRLAPKASLPPSNISWDPRALGELPGADKAE